MSKVAGVPSSPVISSLKYGPDGRASTIVSSSSGVPGSFSISISRFTGLLVVFTAILILPSKLTGPMESPAPASRVPATPLPENTKPPLMPVREIIPSPISRFPPLTANRISVEPAGFSKTNVPVRVCSRIFKSRVPSKRLDPSSMTTVLPLTSNVWLLPVALNLMMALPSKDTPGIPIILTSPSAYRAYVPSTLIN